MDILKMFKEYLPKWSEEKMQPLPTKELSDRWAVAWQDFVKDVLTPMKHEVIADYKAMKFKTFGDLEKEEELKEKETKTDEVVEIDEVEETRKLTEWEKVKAMLNND